MSKYSIALLFVLFISLSATAQDDPIKVSTNLIQLDVTVTDKDGNIVTDLRPDEFEIFENGKKQKLTNFLFVSLDSPALPPDPAKKVNDPNPIPPPPVRLTPGEIRRTYALVIDDLGISLENLPGIRQSLRKFIENEVRDGDLVAIIRTGSGIGTLQSFTSDKRVLLAAVDRLKWNPFGRAGVSTFQPIDTSKFAIKEAEEAVIKQFEEQRNETFAVGTLGALTQVIRGMRNLPGRKSIVVFSEGFVSVTNNQSNRVYESLRVLADFANRSSVVVYTIDPRGLQPSMFYAEDRIGDVISDRTRASFEARRNLLLETQFSLSFLANETGGLAYSQNDAVKGLRQATADQRSYYLLGYQPDVDVFDPKKAKFNKIVVKVTRPGIKVRYRSGFYGVSDERIREKNDRPEKKLLGALTSPFDANGVGLDVYPVFQNDPVAGNLIKALVYINAADLNFQSVNGKMKANFDLIAMTFGDNGQSVDQFVKNYSIEVTEAIQQSMIKNGFVYALDVPIAKPGAYQFRVALRDTVSNKVGSASRFVEVPNTSKKLALSNLIVDAFSPEEWKRQRTGGNRDDSERSVLLDTTARKFKTGNILRYDYVIYDPKTGGTEFESVLRLAKEGKLIVEEKPVTVNADGQTDRNRIQAAGAITLGRDLEPGTYVLQIIVYDKSNPKRAVTQFVDIEIIG